MEHIDMLGYVKLAKQTWSELTLSPQVGLGVDSVLVDGVDVVLRGLQGSEFRPQVTVLTAV